MRVSTAAKQYNVPRKTLDDYVRRQKTGIKFNVIDGDKTIFSAEQDIILANRILEL